MSQDSLPAEKKVFTVTEYDRQMAEVIESAIAYLATPRGQKAINILAQRNPKLHRAVSVRAHHEVPWHNLGVPGWGEEHWWEIT